MTSLLFCLVLLVYVCHSQSLFIRVRKHCDHCRLHSTQQELTTNANSIENNPIKSYLRQKLNKRSWFDECFIHVRGGSGGAGSNEYTLGKGLQQIRPCGGSGGNGGSVVLVAESRMNTLVRFKSITSYRGESGKDGAGRYQNGFSGSDSIVNVPAGTIIWNNDTNEVIGELLNHGDRLVVAKGGIGGNGNAAVRAKGEKGAGCTPPTGGGRACLKLELKIVADVGLIGVPNAGKSTLLSALTNANPKIASYAFTTLIPNLGVCFSDPEQHRSGSRTMVIADIPGLIEGAHEGRGLGIKFLKHIERCRIVIHVVNGESSDPIGEYMSTNRELLMYSSILANKPQIVVLNKLDIPSVKDKENELLQSLQAHMQHTRLLSISAHNRTGIEELVSKTQRFLDKLTPIIVPPPTLPAAMITTTEEDDED